MAYDEHLAERVRRALADRADVREQKMFGGLAFLIGGNMSCGVLNSELMLRLGAEDADAALDAPHTREMDFTGRPLTGFLFVTEPGLRSDAALEAWIELAADYAGSLPHKASARKARKK